MTYRGALERSRHPRRRPVHHVPRIPLSRRHRRQPPNAVRSTGHSSAALSVLTATPTKLASGCSPHGNRSRRSPRLSIAIAPAATLLEPHHARLRPRRPPRSSPRVPLDFALEKWCAGHPPLSRAALRSDARRAAPHAATHRATLNRPSAAHSGGRAEHRVRDIAFRRVAPHTGGVALISGRSPPRTRYTVAYMKAVVLLAHR